MQASTPSRGVYKKRDPERTIFRRILSGCFQEFLDIYEEQFVRKYGFLRKVIPEAVAKYMDCGILRHGFARIQCGSCGEECLNNRKDRQAHNIVAPFGF